VPVFSPVAHDRLVYDTSFVRFKTLSLSYSLPKDVVKKLLLERVQLTFSANNIKTWTKWPGLDPESITQDNAAVSAFNSTRAFNVYPLMRTYSFSVNIGL
jgi:hypothetical protein